jgi:hypothetical protein
MTFMTARHAEAERFPSVGEGKENIVKPIHHVSTTGPPADLTQREAQSVSQQ